MSVKTDDVRVSSLNQLIAPVILMHDLPIGEEVASLVASARRQTEAILAREDDRLLVVVGPCSIHDPKAALEYAERLKAWAEANEKNVFIIMRVYFEKPRTTVGWKGLINDPDMNDTFDINKGLRVARKLLLDLGAMGMPAGTEFLDTISPQYVADVVSWGAIGARTTESQIHRELASGLSCPVGFKNGTGGNYQIAIDAVRAAHQPHHFLSVTKSGDTAIVNTTGNTSCHLILRGGKSGPNHDAASVNEVAEKLKASDLPPSLMVDCSHANSGKDHRKQPAVASELAAQISGGSRHVTAVMLESHLQEGNQPMKDLSTLEYGKSVTDACMSWEMTVPVLDELAAAVEKRRSA